MTDLAIEMAGITRHFGDVRAVDGLDLRVPRGGVYGFLGPNGAGKTTTIRLLLGLARPDRGDIRLNGAPLTRASRRLLVRRVGSLVEAPSLYPHLTGYENLRVTQGCSRCRDHASTACWGSSGWSRTPIGARDLGLSDRGREVALAGVLAGPREASAVRPSAAPSRASAALTLRALLEDDRGGLSAGEAAFLTELLDRLGAGESPS